MKVDQSADGGPTDVDRYGRPGTGGLGVERHRRRLGGVRPRRVPVDVQAHTLWIETAPGDDTYRANQA